MARESEELCRSIVDSATAALIALDKHGAITAFNPAAERMFGYDAAEIAGKDVKTLLPVRGHPAHDAHMALFARPGGPRPARDAEGRRKDGTTFPMQFAIAETMLAGERIFTCVAEDLTARKSIEQKLSQAQKLEAVGQLAGGIAHDFNNLLTVILSNLELLKERMQGDALAGRLIDSAARSADTSAKLTNKLLAFSRHGTAERRVYDIGGLILDMKDMLRRTLGDSVSVVTVIPSGPLAASINKSDFETALLNLAINARDAMPEGGTITIEINPDYIEEDYAARHPGLKPGAYIAVAVSDTGGGIPKHQMEKVFEPFFTTKEGGKGAGLGLSMCHGFVRQSGGHIVIYSEVGRGTTVRLYLPCAGGQSLPAPDLGERWIDVIAERAPKVLIVDDNDDVRQSGVATLNALNCRVLEASDAVHALELLERHDDIDVLFTDFVMSGGMNGIMLAAEARKRSPGIKVLFGSGFAAAATMGSQGLGADEHFVAKPYRRGTLAEKLLITLAERKTA